MQIYTCGKCNTRFESKTKDRRFCSRLCYHNSKIGTKQSSSCIEKRKQKMLGKTYSERRRENIGRARTILVTAEQTNQIVAFIELGMPDGFIETKLNLTHRRYKRYKNQLYPTGVPWQIKWLENDVEPSVVEEVVRLTRLRYRYKRIAAMVDLHHKTVKRILLSLSKKDPTIECHPYDNTSWAIRKESGPERIVREFLERQGVDYRQEVSIEHGSKWLFDFHILETNLLIEVQGDYWHCNPKVFAAPINEYQKWSRQRDHIKEKYANRLGYVVYPIWEFDLKTDKESVFSSIEREVKKCQLER